MTPTIPARDLALGDIFQTCLTGRRGIVFEVAYKRNMASVGVILAGRILSLCGDIHVYRSGPSEWFCRALQDARQEAEDGPGGPYLDPVAFLSVLPRNRRPGRFAVVSAERDAP